MGGREAVSTLVVPNLKPFGEVLAERWDGKKEDVEMAVAAVMGCLDLLVEERDGGAITGKGGDAQEKVKAKVGEFVGERVIATGKQRLVDAVLEA